MEEINDIQLLTRYISIWGWELIAIIFLCFSLLYYSFAPTLINNVLCTAFFIIFICCQFMVLLKQRQFYGEEGELNKSDNEDE